MPGDAFQVLPFQIELVPSTKRKESASFILLSGRSSASRVDIRML